MKVLMLNGSPHEQGVGNLALEEMKKVFDEEGIETEIVQVGNQAIRGCSVCRYCVENGKCVYNDLVNEVAKKFEEADGLVISSPVYYASPNGTMISFLDRLFYSAHFNKTMKVGASIATARRGGLTATYDVLNKYFGISGMPIASGQYWNGLHGGNAEQAQNDEEGLQMMRTLAHNMAFLIKSIELGKEKYGIPEKEKTTFTNFIR